MSSRKVGETSVLRGMPASERKFEVSIDRDWLVADALEWCVYLAETAAAGGGTVTIFARSMSPRDARALGQLLLQAAGLLEGNGSDEGDTE